MNATLKRASAPIALALSAGISTEVLGYRAFGQLVQQDVRALCAHASAGGARIVSEEMLQDLPDPVRRYFRHSGVVGKPIVRSVFLRQKGRMRPGSLQQWMGLDAEQWYCVDPPGFVWSGTVRMGPVPVGRARDMYLDGKGHMTVKVASLFPVVDATGEEMDRGSMMRYLSEMVWFPSALLGDNISFEAVDDRSARVILTDHGRTATATMFFDEEGRLTDFVAKRYRILDESCDLETWSTPITGYGEFEGVQIPIGAKALWKLAEGDDEYFDVTIIDLHFDVWPDTVRPAAPLERSA